MSFITTFYNHEISGSLDNYELYVFENSLEVNTLKAVIIFSLVFFITVGRKFTQEVFSFTDGPDSRYGIDEKVVQFPIQHFSRYFLRFRSQRPIQMYCDAMLPQCMSSKRQLTARVYVYKAQIGMEEVKFTQKQS